MLYLRLHLLFAFIFHNDVKTLFCSLTDYKMFSKVNQKLLIFDTHPVQYRAPLWRKMHQLAPGSIHVAYASDCSVKGHEDKDFGLTFSWDEPLLDGYPYTILNSEKGNPLNGWGSLTEKGVKGIIDEISPDAILLTGLNYRYEWAALIYALLKGIPIWLRTETQDYAFTRTKTKSYLRYLAYTIAYKGINRFFYIGNLNKEHYLSHGVSSKLLSPALYCTVNRYSQFTTLEKEQIRAQGRAEQHLLNTQIVIGFSGKFIEKKDPLLIYKSLKHISPHIRERLHLYFVGNGPLSAQLENEAKKAYEDWGINTTFAGFVNQSQIGSHYLLMDILVLPSKRMGETWGLVVNEAIQAGCSIAISNAVGCCANFSDWPRVQIFNESQDEQLAQCLEILSEFNHNLEWGTNLIQKYSIEESAQNLLNNLR